MVLDSNEGSRLGTGLGAGLLSEEEDDEDDEDRGGGCGCTTAEGLLDLRELELDELDVLDGPTFGFAHISLIIIGDLADEALSCRTGDGGISSYVCFTEAGLLRVLVRVTEALRDLDGERVDAGGGGGTGDGADAGGGVTSGGLTPLAFVVS